MRAGFVSTMVLVALLACFHVRGQTLYQSDADFTKFAMKLRESAILHLEAEVAIPTQHSPDTGPYPWKTSIIATVFWIGGGAKGEGRASAWDSKWEAHYGGFDNPNPAGRRNFIPIDFVPRLNPFYVALPYNDIAKGATKPEARVVIPWFRELVDRGEWQEGRSICRDRWVLIRNSAGKACYAQWSDCGPFRADHWQYVFGNEKPRPNANAGAGLNVSPAVRDYLDLDSTDVVDWKFVRVDNVPAGPWALYGENNPLTKKDHAPEPEVPAAPAPPAANAH
jgi:hypothetical protein